MFDHSATAIDDCRLLTDDSPYPFGHSTSNHRQRANYNFMDVPEASPNDKSFVRKILSGENQRPRRADRQRLCEKHVDGATLQLVFDLLKYIEKIDGISRKLSESVSALKCIVEKHSSTGTKLKTLYADEIGKRKYQNRGNVYRCIGSTLLVKGLEFDHVIIVRDSNWQQNWGNHKDLYVALTRGSKTTTLLELM